MSNALGGLVALLALLFLFAVIVFEFAIYLVAASGLLSLGANFLYGPGTAQAWYNTIVIIAGVSSFLKVCESISKGIAK